MVSAGQAASWEHRFLNSDSHRRPSVVELRTATQTSNHTGEARSGHPGKVAQIRNGTGGLGLHAFSGSEPAGAVERGWLRW
jgi:hypothetical protein